MQDDYTEDRIVPGMFTFTYRPDAPYYMLSNNERLSLNIVETDRRFQQEINKALCPCAPTEQVTNFVIENNSSEIWAVSGDNPWNRGRFTELNLQAVRDVYINFAWLTYDSPQSHCAALANALRQETVNHAVILRSVLAKNYADQGYTVKQLFDMVDEYKDQALWERTRFVLG